MGERLEIEIPLQFTEPLLQYASETELPVEDVVETALRNYLERSQDYALRHIEIKQINPGCRMSSILSTWQSRCQTRKQRLSHCSMM